MITRATNRSGRIWSHARGIEGRAVYVVVDAEGTRPEIHELKRREALKLSFGILRSVISSLLSHL